MGAGLVTVTAVVAAGGSPSQYTLTCTDTSGVTNGDHLTGELSDGTDAVWLVLSVDSSIQLTVEDSLTEGNNYGGSPAEFGTPAAGTFGYATKRGNLELTAGAEGAKGWRALVERCMEILSDGVAWVIRETGGPTELTIGNIADGEFLKRSGTTVIGDAGSVATHKDTHKSGGADAFASTDLLEAMVKRIYEAGGSTLTVGAIADGEYLVRSGSGIAGASPSTSVLTNVCGGRLTPSTSDPVGEESTGVDDLYYLPHSGDYVALHDGSSSWSYHQIPSVGVSFDVSTDTDLDAASIAVDSNYDVFLYNNASTLELHLKKWTDSTTRATALAYQDGVLVLSGSTAYRYLGTIRTEDVSSAPKIVDDYRRRFIWNFYNRVTRRNVGRRASPASYTASSPGSTAQQTLNGGGYDEFKHEFVIGLDHYCSGTLQSSVSFGSGSSYRQYVFLDGAQDGGGMTAATTVTTLHVIFSKTVAAPGIGYHYWEAYEMDRGGAQVNLGEFTTLTTEGEW